MSTTESDDRKLYGDIEGQGFNNEITEAPVEDWAKDWDHTDEVWAADPFPIWDDLRHRLPGRPHRPLRRRAGCRPPTRTSSAVAYDTDHFTSRMVVVGNHRPPFETGAAGRVAAHLVRPAVPPRRPPAAAAGLRAEGDRGARAVDPRVLRRAARRSLEGKHVVDAAVEYAQHIPVRVIAHMLGFPAGGRRPVPRVRRRTSRGREHAARGAASSTIQALVRVPRRADRRPRRQPARRPHLVPARRRDGRRAARPTSTSPARWRCC